MSILIIKRIDFSNAPEPGSSITIQETGYPYPIEYPELNVVNCGVCGSPLMDGENIHCDNCAILLSPFEGDGEK